MKCLNCMNYDKKNCICSISGIKIKTTTKIQRCDVFIDTRELFYNMSGYTSPYNIYSTPAVLDNYIQSNSYLNGNWNYSSSGTWYEVTRF